MVRKKMLLVKLGQLCTVKLSQKSEWTILYHMIIALALIGRPHKISRHIGLPSKSSGSQFICFFSFYFQFNTVFGQQL